MQGLAVAEFCGASALERICQPVPSGLRDRDQSVVFRVLGLEFRIQGSGFGLVSLESRIQGLGFSAYRVWSQDCRRSLTFFGDVKPKSQIYRWLPLKGRNGYVEM